MGLGSKMKTLCIFTPTFQRAHLLPRLYNSLVSQSCQDFVWLIIDDGSTDDTRALTERWIKESKIEIKYVYKKNGGMHTAHNVAYSIIDNEINTCIDSDDWMPDSAVELIIKRWKNVRHCEGVSGIIGLDATPSGDIVGTRLPPDYTQTTLGLLHSKYRIKGDKKVIYRSDIIRSFPRYPEFDGEKLVPLGTLYRLIDQKYSLMCFNDVYAVVEYQVGGSSDTVIQQYFQSPRGFRESRKIFIKYSMSISELYRNVIHYGISSKIINEKNYQIKSPTPILSIICTPVVNMIYIYLLYKKKMKEKRAVV